MNGNYSSNNFQAVVSFPKMTAGLIIQVDIFALAKRKKILPVYRKSEVTYP